MYEGKTGTLFAKYAIPQMIGLLFNSIYLIVDGIFIGNRLGREAMAAAAVSVPFIEILIALAMAVASGAGIIISNCIGRAQKDMAVRTFNVAVVCCVTLGLLVAALGNALLDPLAEVLGSTPAIHAQATQYLWYIVTFSPFLLLSFLLGGLARNDGRPKLAMFALAFGSVSNIVLDYVFMYPLDMGIAGAALATALGPIFSVLILLPHFLRGRGNLRFARPLPSLRLVRRIFLLGFPAFIMEFTIGIVTFVYNFAITRYGYGEIGLAAYLVIGYLMLYCSPSFWAWPRACSPCSATSPAPASGRETAPCAALPQRCFSAWAYCAMGSLRCSPGSFSPFSPPRTRSWSILCTIRASPTSAASSWRATAY